jgi:hypothetical protein
MRDDGSSVFYTPAGLLAIWEQIQDNLLWLSEQAA